MKIKMIKDGWGGQIRFRVRDIFGKKWMNNAVLMNGGRDGMCALMVVDEKTGQISAPRVTATCVQNFEVLQGTGLEDKTGEEIYEGDIISCYEYQGERLKDRFHPKCLVTFNRGSYFYSIRNEIDTYTQHCFLMYAKNPIILGNMYDNPELVK